MADTQQQKRPKIKFKKRNIKKKQLRKAVADNNDNDDDFTAAAAAAAAGTNSENKSNDALKQYNNNHDEEEEEEEGALTAILAVERRRKLLNNRNRGVDSANLLKASNKSTDNNKSTTNAATSNADNKDLEERLKGNFSIGKLAGSNDMGGGDDDGGILARKHKLAMEEFIQSNLQSAAGGAGGAGVTTTMESNGGEATAITHNNGAESGPTEDEKELFAELLLSSSDATTNNQAKNDSQSKEGDVGAGGAMMMGSGIAEVALPVSERLKTLKATEKAAMEYEKSRSSRSSRQHDGSGGNEDQQFSTTADSTSDNVDADVVLVSDLPMNFASGPGKRKRQDVDDMVTTKATTTATSTLTKKEVAPSTQTSSSAAYSASSAGGSVQRSDVSTLGQSYSHNFQLHQQDWIAQRRDERQSEIDTLKTQHKADDPEDDANGGGGRMGFEMARRVAKGESVRPPVARGPNGESLKNEWDRKKGGSHKQRSNDDRVWKQFMKKTKR